MSVVEIQECQKVTIAELQRFLPFQPPTFSTQLPTKVKNFLASPSYNNLSYRQQNKKKAYFQIAYRNYFKIQKLVDYIQQITQNKFSTQSVQQAMINTAQRYELIDWYKFVRVVCKNSKKAIVFSDKSAAAQLIQRRYKIYIQKYKNFSVLEEIAVLKNSQQRKLVQQFTKEAVKQIKDHIVANMASLKLASLEEQLPKQVVYFQFEKIINKRIECHMDLKKIKFLFIRYETKRKGAVSIKEFLKQVMPEQKIVVVETPGIYISSTNDIAAFVKDYLLQHFRNGADIVSFYIKHYQEEKGQNLQLLPEEFYNFLKDKCQNKLSFIQTQKLRKTILFVNHLQFLYKMTDLSKIQKESKKQEEKMRKKKQLKKQNQVFYHFRTLILNLISKCKSEKLTREEFTHFATSIDPSLKYNAFYAVWRVYPSAINVQRLKQQSNLHPLACYLKVNFSPQLYEKKIEQLLQQVPAEQSQMAGYKIQQRINFNFDFILQTLKMKLFPSKQLNTMNYHKTLYEIFPKDFEQKMRSFIFRKVSQKFVVLWRNVRKIKKMKREKQLILKVFQLAKQEQNQKQKQKKQAVDSKNKRPKPKILGSAQAKKNKQIKDTKDKKSAENQALIRDILTQVIQNLGEKQEQRSKSQPVYKKEVVLACPQKYTFRSNLTRISFNTILGIISFSKEFLLLNAGKSQQLNIKLPFRPSIQAIDFIVWGNNLAVLTSLSSIQLFALTQTSQYPYKTLYLQKNIISQSILDQIVSNRLYRLYPTLLLVDKQKLWVNLFNSKKIVIIDSNPKIQWFQLSFSFKQHFLPQITSKIFKVISKSEIKQRKAFVEQVLSQAVGFNSKQQQKIENSFQFIIKHLNNENVSHFHCMEWYQWLKTLGSAAKCVLNWELNLKTKRHIPQELKRILQLLKDYMLSQNLSLHQIVKLMKKAQKSDERVSLKQFKQYLLKIAYEQFIQHQKMIDKFLGEVTVLKTIQYHQLADIIGHQWSFSPLQKPYLVIYSFVPIYHLDLIIYTVVGFPHIFIKQVSKNKLLGILKNHSSTPIIYLVPEQLILFSADSQCQRGTYPNICVWRIFQDILQKFRECPPWKAQPFYQLSNSHEQAISSISFIKTCNTLVTTSIDGSFKFWSIQTDSFSIVQTKRIYSDDSYYLSAYSFCTISQKNHVSLQKLVVTKISRQISANNAYPFEITIQQSFCQQMRVKIPGEAAALPLPVRLSEVIAIQGTRNALKKKALISNFIKYEIQQLAKGTRVLQSIDKNFYHAVKSAYIFVYTNQLKALFKFLQSKKEQAQNLVKVFCQKYGLNLIEEIQSDELQLPPSLQLKQTQKIEKCQQLYICEDSVDQILKNLNNFTSSPLQLIDQHNLQKIILPHLFGELQDKFKNIVARLSQKRSDKLISITDIKALIKVAEFEGTREKFSAACRALNRRLKRSKMQIWQIFTANMKELDKNRKIRVIEFTQKLRKIGLQTQYINKIVENLSRNGVITLFQIAHFLRLSIQQTNPSQLFPNYSGIMLSQSQLMTREIKQLSPENNSSVLHNKKMSVQSQMKSMLLKHESKAISESSSVIFSRRDSKSMKEEDIKSSQMMHSGSQGSLSREGKDKLRREAQNIMKKVKELLQNQGKSLWEVVAIACSEFVKQPLISQTQYFLIFNYIRTPVRLLQKLKLLEYLRRQSVQKIDLNHLFQLLDSSKKLQGEKYLVLHMVNCLEANYSSILEHGIQLAFFSENDQITPEEFLRKLASPPFQCARFALTQWQTLISEQRIVRFGCQELKKLLQSIIIRHHMNIQFNKISLLNQLIFRVEKKGESLTQLFPSVPKVILEYFRQCASKIQAQGTWDQDYKSIQYSIGKKLQSVSWKIFIQELQKRMGKANSEAAKDAQAARKLFKALQARKISPLQFFVAIDRNRKLFITQQQLQLGLVEMGVNYDFWADIPKKYSKRLFYNQFLSFLFNCNALPYKAADSALQIAIDKFLKRFLRGDDIESCFKRLSGGNPEVTFTSFKSALKMINFDEEESKLLHSFFSNQKIVRGRRWGNEQLLNDPSNLSRVFNFKQFSETVITYRGQNIVKSAAFRFYDYLKKRCVSLTFEFKKWLDNNKKIKQVGQALKKQTLSLPKSIFISFLSGLHRGLSENDFKQILMRWKEQVDFHAFVAYLEDTYKKGLSRVEKEQALQYLKQIVQCIQKLNVTIPRLFGDFANKKGKMGLVQLTSLSQWLGTGLTKIQLKKILGYIDSQKEGYFGLNLLADAIQTVQASIQKQQEDFRFDYIIQKLAGNKQKFVLKNSKLLFTIQRTQIIFQSILNNEECEFLFKQTCKEIGKSEISQKQMQEYISKKILEIERRVDKKDKQTGLKLINYLTKLGVEIDEAYGYISKHNKYEQVSKQQFILILQSFQIKVDLAQINSLYQFLEEGKGKNLQRIKWQEKLGMLKLSIQEHLSVNNEDLRVFYKVKLFLSELYILFIKKSYKSLQIYHFFDRNTNGILSHDLFLTTLVQLGVKVQHDLATKLTNYLDRNRDGTISVHYLLQQLQKCMGSKMRLVLNTKTSMLFKQKSKILSDQSNKFIHELAKRQELDSDSNKSTIADYAFVSLLKQFGCILKQDQIQDIRKNFEVKDGQLSLYPIYQSFANLFQNTSPLPTAQRDRYRNLMIALVQNNFTFSHLQKLSNRNDLLSFIEQLGVFTLMQAKTIVQSNLIEGSNSINIQILKNRLRDSYLTEEEQTINQSFIRFGNSTNEDLKNQLSQTIDFSKLKQNLKSYADKLSLQDFYGLLWESGIWITKGAAKKYFQTYADGQTLQVSKLADKNPESLQQIKTSNNFKEFQDAISQKENQKLNITLLERGCMRIAQHIVKSLNFKGVSLDKQLTKFYKQNYGFITYYEWLDYFKQIGIQNREPLKQGQLAKQGQQIQEPKQSQQIKDFMEQYWLRVGNYKFDKEVLLKTWEIQSLLEEVSQICTMDNRQKRIFIEIRCKEAKEWIKTWNETQSKLYEWLYANGIKDYSLSSLYQFLSENYEKKQRLIPYLLKCIPPNIGSYSEFFEWLQLQTLTKNEEDQSKIDKNESTIRKAEEVGNYFKLFMVKNPIKFHAKSVKKFTQNNSFTQDCNTQRISSLLFLNSVLSQKSLLEFTPVLVTPQPHSLQAQMKVTQIQFNYNIKTVSNIIVDQEVNIDQNGLLLINNKYNAFPLDYKYQFESMATISTLLQPSCFFVRTKNFYLWQGNRQSLPKGSLSYSWKYIPLIGRKILQQLSKVHSAGYCLPQLKWTYLNKKAEIQKPLYPCPIDKQGNIKIKFGFSSIDYQSSYCCPELFGLYKNEITTKCDSWIFGCLLYEFIYGHPPSSFTHQIKEYLAQTGSEFSLAEVLEMQQLPVQFNYTFYNQNELNQLFSLQHELRPKAQCPNLKYFIRRQQSLSGLTYGLQFLYQDELSYYQDQFRVIKELNHIIWQCLSLNPNSRPSIQQLLQNPIFQSNEEIGQYLQTLANHKNNIQFYKINLEPLFEMVNQRQQQQADRIITECLVKLDQSKEALRLNKKINSKYVIPKQYPWPYKVQGTFSQNILANKQIIRSASNFGCITLLFQSSFFDIIILLAFFSDKTNIILKKILNLLLFLLPQIQQYESPLCMFIPKILDYLLRILYSEPWGFIDKNWQNKLWLDAHQNKVINQKIHLIKKNTYLRTHDFDTDIKRKCKSLLQQLVLLTGQGNAQYLPVNQYLIQNPQVKELLENVFSQIDLNGSKPFLAFRYFLDRLNDDFKANLQIQLKVEVDVLRLLHNKKQEKQLCLSYIRQYLSLDIQHKLFKQLPIYSFLLDFIRNPLQDISVKQISLEIVSSLLDHNKYKKRLMSPSANLLQQICRLMLEPPRTTAAHEEYQQLRSYLFQIAIKISQNRQMFLQLQLQNECIQTIIQNLLDKQENYLPLQSMSNLQSRHSFI